MKLKVILPMLLAGIGFNAIATDMQQQMVDMSINQMEARGDFVTLAELSGLDISTLEQEYRDSFKTCFNEEAFMQDEENDTFDQCLMNEFTTNIGVSKAKFQSWVDAAEDDEDDKEVMTPLDIWFTEMDSLNEQIYALEDKQQLSATETKQLQQLEEKKLESLAKRPGVSNKEIAAIKLELESLRNKN
ncbi:hypothetical protein ACRN9C_16980 [Shewanella frigidimarina]|jgi:hypothetical protein|uniref:hypothetical protein n=1 Tax=Shewanella frigidimarina TaxID=56812 RepID=UPI003D7B26F8|tara:strand:- start:1854 stop:2417 length:564 start_codon:yes stop_codon:yes gene_type:complete